MILEDFVRGPLLTTCGAKLDPNKRVNESFKPSFQRTIFGLSRFIKNKQKYIWSCVVVILSVFFFIILYSDVRTLTNKLQKCIHFISFFIPLTEHERMVLVLDSWSVAKGAQ